MKRRHLVWIAALLLIVALALLVRGANVMAELRALHGG